MRWFFPTTKQVHMDVDDFPVLPCQPFDHCQPGEADRSLTAGVLIQRSQNCHGIMVCIKIVKLIHRQVRICVKKLQVLDQSLSN